MDKNEHEPPSLSSEAQRMHEGTSSTDGFFDDKLQQDNVSSIAYSYPSTLSTSYSMSNYNRVASGGPMSRIYSLAGSSLEQGLGKFAYRARLGSYAKAVATLLERRRITDMIRSEDMRENEKACKILLICAGSDDRKIQVQAFEKIIEYFVYFSSRARSAFVTISLKRNDIIDVVVFSWKRPGFEYSAEWLYWYMLASRCLSTNSSLVIEMAVRYESAPLLSLDFEYVHEVLSCCSDSTDVLLAFELIIRYWNGKGTATYVRKLKYSDPVLKRFTSACIARYELYSAGVVRFGSPENMWWPVHYFMTDLWRSWRGWQPGELVEFSDDGLQLAVWRDIFTLHFIFQHGSEENARLQISIPSISKTWKELCLKQLSSSEHTMLREALLGLEAENEDNLYKHFKFPRRDL